MRPGETTLRHLLAPLKCDLEHPGTTEIVCQKPGEIASEIDGKWRWRTVPELTFERLDAISVLAGNLLSKPFDPANPIVESTLPDGQRYTAVRPPVTPTGSISMTIRCPFRRVTTVHHEDFVGLMDEAVHQAEERGPAADDLLRLYHAKDWPEFFALAVQAHMNIAAVGATHSGKTTFLRRIMQSIPPDERVITIEDTAEFGELPGRNRVSLIYGSAGITAEKLCETSLRLRPDRCAMQELRGPEAFAYLRLRAAGHPGGFTSWHAEESDPFTPLALMVKSAERGRAIPDDKLDVMLRSLIDIIVVCRRDTITHRLTVPSVYFRLANDDHTVRR